MQKWKGCTALYFTVTLCFLILAPFSFGEPNITPSEINSYLIEKSSPIIDHGNVFVNRGLEFKVDPRLIVAIAGAESTFGRFICTPFNAWNWFWQGPCPRSPFMSWAEGIRTVTKFMRRSYLNKGYDTISLIASKYCAEGCENWIPLVTRFYQDELGGDSNDLGFSGAIISAAQIQGFVRIIGEVPDGASVAGNTVFLLNPETFEIIAQTITDISGFYQFSVSPGSYTLSVEGRSSGDCFFNADAGPLNVAARQTVNQDFDLVAICPVA